MLRHSKGIKAFNYFKAFNLHSCAPSLIPNTTWFTELCHIHPWKLLNIARVIPARQGQNNTAYLTQILNYLHCWLKLLGEVLGPPGRCFRGPSQINKIKMFGEVADPIFASQWIFNIYSLIWYHILCSHNCSLWHLLLFLVSDYSCID